jgi:hypothetical protein
MCLKSIYVLLHCVIIIIIIIITSHLVVKLSNDLKIFRQPQSKDFHVILLTNLEDKG